jgi:pimeloyl-ACP methyl ester carboxylesterase
MAAARRTRLCRSDALPLGPAALPIMEMPFVRIAESPLLPGKSPIDLHYRELGRRDGEPLLILHGGWGYEVYPFDAQIAALSDYRIVIPDRTGYGKSPHIADLPAQFHRAAAIEHEAMLEALGIARCAIWGHSDGAVIAAIMAVRRPERVRALILEALHLDREKPRSRAFFTEMVRDPDSFGRRVVARLITDHGDDYWRTIIQASGRAWLEIAAHPEIDLFEHRLREITAPVLVLHGGDDPRTEPGELDRVASDLPHATVHWLATGGHAPHSKRGTAGEVTAVAAKFLQVNH